MLVWREYTGKGEGKNKETSQEAIAVDQVRVGAALNKVKQ